MATNVYDSDTVSLIDGAEVRLEPLKIKFLKEFMRIFDLIKFANTDEQSITILSECAAICMRQNYPIIQTREQLEDVADLPTIYKVLEICAGIRINSQKDNVEEQAKEEKERNSWNDLDLASLEAEVFLIGSWKNFQDLEASLNMSELIAIVEKTRELDYNEKKFLAAMQGVDLDKESGNKQDEWEKMKARVFSGNTTENPDDILALQGQNAVKAGFGIGMGLSYEKL